MTNEQMQQCMNNNFDHIQQVRSKTKKSNLFTFVLFFFFFVKYYLGTKNDQEQTNNQNLIGDIVTRMIVSKHI